MNEGLKSSEMTWYLNESSIGSGEWLLLYKGNTVARIIRVTDRSFKAYLQNGVLGKIESCVGTFSSVSVLLLDLKRYFWFRN